MASHLRWCMPAMTPSPLYDPLSSGDRPIYDFLPSGDFDSRASVPDSGLHSYGEGDLVAGKYVLVRPIGEGGMGSVWHARDIFEGIPVAIKLLRHEHRIDGPQREYLSERLTREATSLAEIVHPAIVRVLDFGVSSSNDPWLAMELLEGESLGSLLNEHHTLPPEFAVQLLLPIAHGLAATHDMGVVHRDLKPDNLFLSIDGRIAPKIIDFGLVKLTQKQTGHKLTGMGLLGTPEYAAPEQALEKPDVDHRADVWAYCIVLYEALSGVVPFSAPSFSETLWAVVQKEAAPLTAIGIDPALWCIIERGLRKKPEERWQSMRDLGNALAAWLTSRGVTVDVTGASLLSQWAVLEAATPAPPPIYEPAVETVFDLEPKMRRRRGRVASGLRVALSAATAAAIMIAPRSAELGFDLKPLLGLF
jgi:serine/threonine protein kinase